MDERYLGIDFGLARVGLALSYGSLAEPLEILPNNDQLLPTIQARIQFHHITHIVLGLSENTMAEKTAAFAKTLEEKTGLPITFQDETLSSAEVQRLLRERTQGKRSHRGPIDHFAATLILQRYLDEI